MAKEDDKFELAADISEMLGLDSEFDTKEDFKAALEEKFIAKKAIADDKELINTLFGKVLGTAQTKLKSSYKNLGVEFEDGEIKDKKFEDIIEIGTKKLEALQSTKFDEFKNNYEGDGKEEIEKLQSQLEEQAKGFKTKYSEIEGLNTDLKAELENKEVKFTTDLKQRDLDLLRKQAFDKVKWARESEGFDLKYKGFQATFNEKYALDLDDERNLIVTDKEGGKIKSESKVGEFESIENILEKEAKAANLLKINDKGGKKVGMNGVGKIEDAGTTARTITTYNR